MSGSQEGPAAYRQVWRSKYALYIPSTFWRYSWAICFIFSKSNSRKAARPTRFPICPSLKARLISSTSCRPSSSSRNCRPSKIKSLKYSSNSSLSCCFNFSKGFLYLPANSSGGTSVLFFRYFSSVTAAFSRDFSAFSVAAHLLSPILPIAFLFLFGDMNKILYLWGFNIFPIAYRLIFGNIPSLFVKGCFFFTFLLLQ